MGSQFSSDNIKYVYANVNGTRVSIPYVRLANGQWIPFQHSDWYSQQQRLMQGTPMVNQYPYSNDYYVPNQVYFNGFLR